MSNLTYLAAHQLIHQKSSDQFDLPDRAPARASTAEPKMARLRLALAALLRRTADRVEPAGVTSGSL
jgi:hypothetical protein